MNIEVISQYCSILGLFLSIFLLIVAAKFDKRIKGLFKEKEDVERFNKLRKDLLTNFESYCLNISKDKLVDIVIISKINNDILRFESCKSVLILDDKIKIWVIKRILKSKKISEKNSKSLLLILGYFVARMEKEEVFRYGK